MTSYNLMLIKHNYLEGERIILRPISLKDAHDMHEYTSDEEATKYIFEKPKDLNQTINLIANYYMKESIGKYAIELKSSRKLIGIVEFRVHEDVKGGDLGFILNRHYWGNGYMTEAGKIILDLAFNTLKLERVFAGHDTRNVASGKVLLRLGMTHEGILRKNRIARGVLIDSAQYSILKEEYFNAVK